MVYQAAHHTFRECIYLKPLRVDEQIPGITAWKHRAGFFVHGRGDRGSDGCIATYDPKQRKQLNAAVKSEKAQVVLTVVEPILPQPVAERLELLNRLA